MSQQQKKPLMTLSAAVCVALALGAPGAMAGVVDNSNNSPVTFGDCGASPGSTYACVGAWDLGNVSVDLFHSDGSTFPSFDPVTGYYSTMTYGDYSVSSVYSDSSKTLLMAKIASKVWPVGEPTGIKVVNDDTAAISSGHIGNCIINTAYLPTGYLDSTPTSPEPVICSSPFQSHKRFKIAMQPATVDGVTSGDGQPIDLVFNSTDDGTATPKPYQVFSKINNYTGKRLAGYKIEVGMMSGGVFKTATDLGINSQLFITLGAGEGKSGADAFNLTDGLATFSHGLFGSETDPNFDSNGFFSNTTAYYSPVTQECTNSTSGTVACSPTSVTVGTVTMTPSDTIGIDTDTSGSLSSNYQDLLGPWLPSDWAPEGIFFDYDSNPDTDPKLMAWWNGTQWMMQSTDSNGDPVYDASGNAVFVPVPQTEFNTWASDSRYSEDVIEDVLNLGINYIVHVGDIHGGVGNSGTFVVRIIPVVAGNQDKPAWFGTTPTPLVVAPTTTTASSGGGGCTVGGDGRFDPIFPALLLAGLGFLGLRRFSRKS